MAARRHHYLISALPALGELGSPPPWEPSDLLEHLASSPGPWQIVRALLLGDDLLLRESVMAGQASQAAPAVLTPAQVAGEQPLPPELAPQEADRPPRVPADAVWAAYYRHAVVIARQQASRFLAAWIGHEIALRNTLAASRARALSLEAADYLVVPDLADPQYAFEGLIAQWSSADDPLGALRLLDRARWAWLADHDAWFSFQSDELAAYAAKLMLLHRWHRLLAEAAPASAADGPKDQQGNEP